MRSRRNGSVSPSGPGHPVVEDDRHADEDHLRARLAHDPRAVQEERLLAHLRHHHGLPALYDAPEMCGCGPRVDPTKTDLIVQCLTHVYGREGRMGGSV